MTLQEYLVKLGWSIDEPSYKKFLGAVSATGATTLGLATAAIETAGAIELMVSRVSRHYESLYYVSQRTGQSVRYIQSTQFAFKQIGLSADDANASIEGIAATLRTQPWLRGLFGGATTPQDVAGRLAKSGLPYFLQAKFAEMIGMSEQTLFHLQKFAKVEAEAQADLSTRQRQAGLDPDALAQKAVNYSRALNRLESDLEIFGDRMSKDLFGPTKSGVEVLDSIVQALNRADAATHGWLGTLEGLVAALTAVAAFEKIFRVLFGFGAGSTTGSILKGALGKGGMIAGGIGALEMIKKNDPETKSMLQQWFGPLLRGMGVKGQLPGEIAAERAPPKGEVGDRLNQAIETFQKAGYSPEAARGIAASLYYESDKTMSPNAFNPQGGGRGAIGIGQWRGERIDRFRQLFGKDIQASTFDEQLQYVLWELQNTESGTGRALKRPGITGRQAAGEFIMGSERPGMPGIPESAAAGNLAEALSRAAVQNQQQPPAAAGGNVTLHSKTDIHVNSGPDAKSTAKSVLDGQRDVNDHLVNTVRNAGDVVR